MNNKIRVAAALISSGLASLQDGAINNGLEDDEDFLDAQAELVEALKVLGYKAPTMKERLAQLD